MRAYLVVSILLFPSIIAGCTESEMEAAEGALGCTYSDATNYNSSSVVDDGSCIYPEPPEPTLGCTYSDALNYNPSASEDDGSCRYPVVEDPVPGCTYSDAYNFEINATKDDGSCVYDSDGDGIIDDFEEPGCTDPDAYNHNSSATDDDGSCDYDSDDDGVFDWAEKEGCLDTNATNYDSSATEGNLTLCEYPLSMTTEQLGQYLRDLQDDSSLFEQFGSVKTLVRVSEVSIQSEEEQEEGDTNANTTAIELIIGHDPENETLYEGIALRFLGDITMEQTTIQDSNGINYRIGSQNSGSWYFARDEVYEYENPFLEEDGDDESDSPGDDGGGADSSNCDLFLDSDNPINWAVNWTITLSEGIYTATSTNGTWEARIELIGNPPVLTMLELVEIDGLLMCSIEVLDPSEYSMTVNTNLPKTSMTMKFENELEEESGSSKTWSGDLGEEHFEEVNLDEILLKVIYINDEGQQVTAGSMQLSEQTSSFTDRCFQWTLSWTDSDNDGYTSADDAYSVTRAEKVVDPCSDDDELRNRQFGVVFYDLWAGMPTGGVFTPGFSFIAAISAFFGSGVIIGRRDWKEQRMPFQF